MYFFYLQIKKEMQEKYKLDDELNKLSLLCKSRCSSYENDLEIGECKLCYGFIKYFNVIMKSNIDDKLKFIKRNVPFDYPN